MPATTPVATGSMATASARSGREREPEQDDDDDRAEHRQALDLALDALARLDREACRRRRRRALSPGVGARVEGAADGGEGALLAVDVGAVGRGRRHQHRARRLARDPDAVIDPRRARRRQRLGDAQRLAGRVAKEDRLEQRAGRRAEQRDGRIDRLAQAGRAEALRVDGRTERVAMLEQEAAGVGPGRVLAVVDRRERAARAQCRGQRCSTPRRARRAAASSPGAPPSMPMTSRREVAPLFS